jgi:hypothetical protein
MPRHCSARSPSEAIPAVVPHCAAWSATTPWHCTTHSRTASAPHPRKRTAEPSKGGGGGRLLHARTGLCRDVRLVGAVTSVAIGPVRPSPPPRRHPGHCIPVPDAVEAYGDRTPPLQPLCLVRPTSTAPSSLHVDGPRTDNLYAATLEAAHGRAQDAP